ncbi:hypothetical protein AB0873_10945 [Micromonospora sp. NPDC047707]|uniref:hypothetical protein n=1 Tax=Micromonospora sp. NPDC047707 TaxID=3154498 RepID=UPI003456100D
MIAGHGELPDNQPGADQGSASQCRTGTERRAREMAAGQWDRDLTEPFPAAPGTLQQGRTR